MKRINSKIFGSVESPSTLHEVIDLALNHGGDGAHIHYWRGQGNIDWKIDSSAYRRLARTNDVVAESAMQRYEEYLLDQATHQGFRYENGIYLSDMELLARLQHHGAATRLIDVSRNIMVGLWFASNSQPESTGLLLGLHSSYLGGTKNNPEKRNYQTIIQNIVGVKHPQTWQPPVVSARIAAQRAQFVYSEVVSTQIGSLAIDKSENAYIGIAISPKLKSTICAQLSRLFDIHNLALYPDIDGFSHAHSFGFDEFQNERC